MSKRKQLLADVMDLHDRQIADIAQEFGLSVVSVENYLREVGAPGMIAIHEGKVLVNKRLFEQLYPQGFSERRHQVNEGLSDTTQSIEAGGLTRGHPSFSTVLQVIQQLLGNERDDIREMEAELQRTGTIRGKRI